MCGGVQIGVQIDILGYVIVENHVHVSADEGRSKRNGDQRRMKNEGG